MAPGTYRFADFCLDPANRQLWHGEAIVDLNARYLDALTLLVGEAGGLVSKDRFLEQVWRGVPVTDEALTQCIKTLRRQLGDNAAAPRFIETVPKHGYRFIAPVATGAEPVPRPRAADPSPPNISLALAGTLGGAFAGLLGGILYGVLAAQLAQPGIAAASVMLVMVCLTTVIALIGAAGVTLGIAAADYASGKPGPGRILGGAAGGLMVGAAVKLLGIEAFNLLIGQSPGNITGAAEGAVLGAGVGLAAWLAARHAPDALRRATLIAAACGAGAGLAITLLGGRMMAGTLDIMARHFARSRLRIDHIGGLFGEDGLGPVSRAVTSALEGALFAACIVGAMVWWARRRA